MISLLIYVLILLLIFGVILYVVRLIPLPPPFALIAQAVVGLILLLVLLDLLLGGRFVGFLETVGMTDAEAGVVVSKAIGVAGHARCLAECRRLSRCCFCSTSSLSAPTCGFALNN